MQAKLNQTLRSIQDSISVLKNNESATQTQLEKYLDDNTQIRNELNKLAHDIRSQNPGSSPQQLKPENSHDQAFSESALFTLKNEIGLIRQTVQRDFEEGAKKNLILSKETEELKLQLI